MVPEKFKNRYRIESNRLQTWDYSSSGGYFITICIHDRDEILGKIRDGKLVYSDAEKYVAEEIIKIPEYNNRANLDEWIIMPDHVHCIVVLGDGGDRGNGNEMGGTNTVEKIHEFSLQPRQPRQPRQPHQSQPPRQPDQPNTDKTINHRKTRRQMIIPKIIGKFKMQPSKRINILHQTMGKKIWQANYYDRIIRDEPELYRIKQYIVNNPINWMNDRNCQNNLWV